MWRSAQNTTITQVTSAAATAPVKIFDPSWLQQQIESMREQAANQQYPQIGFTHRHPSLPALCLCWSCICWKCCSAGPTSTALPQGGHRLVRLSGHFIGEGHQRLSHAAAYLAQLLQLDGSAHPFSDVRSTLLLENWEKGVERRIEREKFYDHLHQKGPQRKTRKSLTAGRGLDVTLITSKDYNVFASWATTKIDSPTPGSTT